MNGKTSETPATGRRKTAVARVRLQPGSGNIEVNRRALDQYFPRPTARMVIRQPLEIAGLTGTYDIVAQVNGGGISAQASAIRHAISRALCVTNPDVRGALKRAGLLTRDPREVERKKYGHHKARKRPQYSKR
jgi:small subunit ribosomal protein S9